MKRKRKKLLTNKKEDFHSSFAHAVASTSTSSIMGLTKPPIQRRVAMEKGKGRELDLQHVFMKFVLVVAEGLRSRS